MSLAENLEKLSNARGVAGREEEIRNLMTAFLKPYADEVVVDKLENVIAIKKGENRQECMEKAWAATDGAPEKSTYPAETRADLECLEQARWPDTRKH